MFFSLFFFFFFAQERSVPPVSNQLLFSPPLSAGRAFSLQVEERMSMRELLSVNEPSAHCLQRKDFKCVSQQILRNRPRLSGTENIQRGKLILLYFCYFGPAVSQYEVKWLFVFACLLLRVFVFVYACARACVRVRGRIYSTLDKNQGTVSHFPVQYCQ